MKSIAKILLLIHIENIHRVVFDKIYIQSLKKKSIIHRATLHYYNVLFFICPKFRPHLKYIQRLFNRAYNQKRLSVVNYCLFLKLYWKNFDRYSEDL